MSIDVLADGLWAYRLGQTTFSMIVVIAGTALLGVGLYRRRAYNRWNRGDDERLLQPPPAPVTISADEDEFDPRLRDDYDPDYDPADDTDLPRLVQPPGRGTVFLIIGTVVLVLGARQVALTLMAPLAPPSEPNIAVGQCITAKSFEQRRMDIDAVDCDRSDATMELAAAGDGQAACPDGLRDDTMYATLVNDRRTNCFALNLRQGHCYAIGDAFTPADCTDPAASIKVDRRIDGESDVLRCPPGTRALSYPQKQRGYCVTAAGGSSTT